MSPKSNQSHCVLCQRETALTFHHLIPKKLHKRNRFARKYSREELNEGLMLCRRCHRGLHKLYSESELGSRLNTEAALREDPAIARHVAWVARQKS